MAEVRAWVEIGTGGLGRAVRVARPGRVLGGSG